MTPQLLYKALCKATPQAPLSCSELNWGTQSLETSQKMKKQRDKVKE